MKIFLLGCNRSGTTWVAETLWMSKILMYYREPMTVYLRNAKNNYIEPWSLPAGSLGEDIAVHRKVLDHLAYPDHLLVKEVHNLCTFHLILPSDARTVVIFRDPTRVLDSYLYNIPEPKNYIDEYHALQKILAHEIIGDPVYSKALSTLGDKTLEYIRRPASEARRYIVLFIMILLNQAVLRGWGHQDCVLHYAALCRDPITQFGLLYQQLGLRYTAAVKEFIMSRRSRSSRLDPYSTFRNDYLVGEASYLYLKPKQVERLREFQNES